MTNKMLFVDRDGTLIKEPADQQVDDVSKLALLPEVIPCLLRLQQAGYALVMVTNQDGLGSASFPEHHFHPPHDLLMAILASQGVHFRDVFICPHLPSDACQCRKPLTGLLTDYIKHAWFDRDHSYVIGDRQSDVLLAENMGIKGLRIGSQHHPDWAAVTAAILDRDRVAQVTRHTEETVVTAAVNLDQHRRIDIDTGIGFFDHMLEQLAKHSGISLQLSVQGDLHVDEHHTVEDTALVLGQAIKQALADKRGIARYGFLLPMDEALAQVAIDLSGRPYFVFQGNLTREQVGGLATELVPHFFRSLADSLPAALHLSVTGDNCHHMIEACFKAVGRALGQAVRSEGQQVPSTKGVL